LLGSFPPVGGIGVLIAVGIGVRVALGVRVGLGVGLRVGVGEAVAVEVGLAVEPPVDALNGRPASASVGSTSQSLSVASSLKFPVAVVAVGKVDVLTVSPFTAPPDENGCPAPAPMSMLEITTGAQAAPATSTVKF
jgi:hypothetical protein